MSQTKFESLLTQYGRSVGIPQASEKLLNGCPVKVDSIVFSLDYDATTTPDHFTIYCDLGIVPNANTTSTQAALLRMNTILYATLGTCIAFSPNKKDHVICLVNLALDKLTVQIFSSTLEQLAKIAHEWRRELAGNLEKFSAESKLFFAEKNNSANAKDFSRLQKFMRL